MESEEISAEPRAFVTGGTGFVGRVLVRRLMERGWAVTLLARSADKAASAADLGARVVEGDLLDESCDLASAMEGATAVFHLAAWYQFGIRDVVRMERINVEGTRRLIAAARKAEVSRFVHCSTVGAHGATGDEERDEGHYDPESVAALPYTQTKRAAHELAQEAAARGLDTVLVSPAGIFGPGDRSMIGRMVELAARGWMRAGFYRDSVMGFVHVEDVAEGLLLAHDRGRSGRDYILVNHTASLGSVITAVCRAAGHGAPWFWLPAWVIRWSRPLGPLFAPLFGQGPGMLRDAVSMMDGVSLRYDGRRARDELGWEPGDFEQQLADTVAFVRSGGVPS